MYSFIIRHLVLYLSLTSCYCECSILYTTALSKSCHGDYAVPIYCIWLAIYCTITFNWSVTRHRACGPGRNLVRVPRHIQWTPVTILILCVTDASHERHTPCDTITNLRHANPDLQHSLTTNIIV